MYSAEHNNGFYSISGNKFRPFRPPSGQRNTKFKDKLHVVELKFGSILQSWTRYGRQRKKHQRQRYIRDCVGREVWRNGNDAITDDINAPVREVDAEVGRGPHIIFRCGGQVRGARCHTWWVKFCGRWDDCTGTTNRALWTWTRNNWLQQPFFDIVT